MLINIIQFELIQLMFNMSAEVKCNFLPKRIDVNKILLFVKSTKIIKLMYTEYILITIGSYRE